MMTRPPTGRYRTNRILAVSDLHGNKYQMRWVIEQRFDILLIAGDLLDHGEGQKQVSDWIDSIDRPLAIASGNHDVMKEGPDWLYDMRGSDRIIDEVGFLRGLPVCVLPWHYDSGDWIDNSSQRCRQVAKMAKPWVLMAHHVPPDEYQGPEDRTRALEFESGLSPRIAVTGHFHSMPSISGGWVNPGQCNFQQPNHAWFDFDSGRGILNTFHSSGRHVLMFAF